MADPPTTYSRVADGGRTERFESSASRSRNLRGSGRGGSSGSRSESSDEPSGLQKPGLDRSGRPCPGAALEPLALALLTKQVDRLRVEIDCPDALLTLSLTERFTCISARKC